MTANRLRSGALSWVLTLQFFVVEALAVARYAAPYSRADDLISALGAGDSPARQLMNASFVVQGALILGGAVLLRPALRGGAARVVPALLGAAAVGVLVVGVFPADGNGTMHAIGAVLYLLAGGLGLVALAYAVRPLSEALGTTVVLLGMVGIAATILFLAGVTGLLGEGGTERAAAYPLPLALALTGIALYWMDRRGGEAPDSAAPRAERERELARRAEQAGTRDAALESATRRQGGEGATGDLDPEDPWTATGQRG